MLSKFWTRYICSNFYLHDVLGLPDDRVSVEVLGGIKPEVELLLSVPFTLCKDVCVESVRVTAHVS